MPEAVRLRMAEEREIVCRLSLPRSDISSFHREGTTESSVGNDGRKLSFVATFLIKWIRFKVEWYEVQRRYEIGVENNC